MHPRGLVGPGNSLPALGGQSAQGGRCKAKNVLLRVFSTLDQTKRIYTGFTDLAADSAAGLSLTQVPIPCARKGPRTSENAIQEREWVSQFLCLHKVGPASKSLQGVGCPPPPLPTASRCQSKAWVVAVLELCPCPRVCIFSAPGRADWPVDRPG